MDQFTRHWITVNSLDEIGNYEEGVLTLRALHYRLVSRGMTNSVRHYKRVVAALIKARWSGLVSFDTFSDHDRETLGMTVYEETSLEEKQDEAQEQIKAWMNSYTKNIWENQEYYIEIWIEKKALQGVFQPICYEHGVSLSPCKGYPSLTFINDAKKRFLQAQKSHKIKIIYFGDYDPSGEDIPRSVRANLWDMGVDVEVDRRLLLEHQVIKWKLPPAPAKTTDSRTASWGGLGQVELDAVEPRKLQRIVEDAIKEHLDESKRKDLLQIESDERKVFKSNLKDFVRSI